MDTALVIGGTRFIGRHTVDEFLTHDFDVAIFNRGQHDNPFASDDVVHVEGDRTDDDALTRAREEIDPDVVIDCVAYYPRDVRAATEIFADVDAYVYVSSGSAYGEEVIPKRENETPLCECTPEQSTDDSWDTYGPRKAAGDRIISEVGTEGVRAMSIRPPVVYGPDDYSGRFEYWIDRVRNYDRLLVPHTALRHLVYVKDVASGIRTVAEHGTAGEAYNVGDHTLPVLTEWIDLLADSVDTDVELIQVGERAFDAFDIAPSDIPLYRSYPHVLDTHKLESLGWTATPRSEAVSATIESAKNSNVEMRGPERNEEERVLDVMRTI
jgi:2'-hydroxyisoflavone reductase